MEMLQTIGQEVYVIPLVLLIVVPLFLTFIIAAYNGSIGKKNFWQDFIIPEIIRWLIVISIVFGFLPALTSLI